MANMFADAKAFNQPLTSWSTGAVSRMEFMFLRATAFNQSLVCPYNHFLGIAARIRSPRLRVAVLCSDDESRTS
jgi:Mycoplasma protein of unknown function, DUF285